MRHSGQQLARVARLDAAKLRELYETPFTVIKIASMYGVKRATIASLMKQYNIPPRTLSATHLGALNHWYGKHQPANVCAAVSARNKRNWEDPAYANKMRAAIGASSRSNWADPIWARKMLLALHRSPTKPEVLVDAAIKRLGLPFMYNGNTGDLVVERRIPDFRPTDETKTVIEVFGEPFHDLSLGFVTDVKHTESATVAHYKEHGYHCVVLWSKPIRAHSKAGDIDAWVGEQIAAQAGGLH